MVEPGFRAPLRRASYPIALHRDDQADCVLFAPVDQLVHARVQGQAG